MNPRMTYIADYIQWRGATDDLLTSTSPPSQNRIIKRRMRSGGRMRNRRASFMNGENGAKASTSGMPSGNAGAPKFGSTAVPHSRIGGSFGAALWRGACALKIATLS